MNSTSDPQLAVAAGATRFFHRHPRLTVFGVLLGACLLVALAFEIGLRLFGTLNIHYYTGTKTPGVHRFPYGEVPINSDGYPDAEFDRSSPKKRIGYVGDSVTFGVGAGYGYRIPDLLEQKYPQYEHWVFAGVGERLEEHNLLDIVGRFNLNSVVYLMNLNDFVPDEGRAEASNLLTAIQKSPISSLDAALRGNSYLYTYLRLGIKNGLQRLGYEHHGLPAFELFPMAHLDVVDSTAVRTAAALTATLARGVAQVCVVILPYEMQVSPEAAIIYRQLGFSWEPGFEQGSTQRAFLERFSRFGIAAFDGREAFDGVRLKVGEAFVYDKGDKIDWNHPTRRGHAILAAWLAKNDRLAQACFGVGGR